MSTDEDRTAPRSQKCGMRRGEREPRGQETRWHLISWPCPAPHLHLPEPLGTKQKDRSSISQSSNNATLYLPTPRQTSGYGPRHGSMLGWAWYVDKHQAIVFQGFYTLGTDTGTDRAGR